MHDIGLVHLHAENATVVRDCARVVGRETHTDQLDMVAALLVVTDGGLYQAGDVVQLLSRTRLPGMLAIGTHCVDAIKYYRETDPVDLRLVLDQGTDGLTDLVVGGLFLSRLLRAGGLLSACCASPGHRDCSSPRSG